MGAVRERAFTEALEFIGEVRGGISYESLCKKGVACSESLINLIRGVRDAGDFVRETGIPRDYIVENGKTILYRLHFNRSDDPFLTLALPRSATQEQIHSRWKNLMLIYHPDRNPQQDPGGRQGEECAKKVNEAYDLLKDASKRLAYEHRAAPNARSVNSRGNGAGTTRGTGGRSSWRSSHQKNLSRRRSPVRVGLSLGWTLFSWWREREASTLTRIIIATCFILVIFSLLVFIIENRQAPISRTRLMSGLPRPGDSPLMTPSGERGDQPPARPGENSAKDTP